MIEAWQHSLATFVMDLPILVCNIDFCKSFFLSKKTTQGKICLFNCTLWSCETVKNGGTMVIFRLEFQFNYPDDIEDYDDGYEAGIC